MKDVKWSTENFKLSNDRAIGPGPGSGDIRPGEDYDALEQDRDS